MYKVAELRKRSEAILEYLEKSKDKTDRFMERFHGYKLDHETADKIKGHAEEALVIVFSAEWCPDCYRNVPVLGLIHEATGLEVRVFGHMMRDSKSSTRKWAVPPSPSEVDEFNVAKIPYVVVLSRKGEKLGEIVENPPQGKTMEQALLDILEP
ncbi:MAG: thioredoxin family protein [Candidatus Bathyarchaeota archaeon]